MPQEYRFLGCADHLIVVGELSAMGCEMDDCDAVVHCGPAGLRNGRDEDGVWRQRTNIAVVPDEVCGDGIAWSAQDVEEVFVEFCDGTFSYCESDVEDEDEIELPRLVADLARDGKPFFGKPFSNGRHVISMGAGEKTESSKPERKPESPKDGDKRRGRKRGRRGGRNRGKGKAPEAKPAVVKVPAPAKAERKPESPKDGGKRRKRQHNGLTFTRGQHRGQVRHECRQGKRLFVWDRKLSEQPVEGKEYDCTEVCVIARGRLLVIAVAPC